MKKLYLILLVLICCTQLNAQSINGVSGGTVNGVTTPIVNGVYPLAAAKVAFPGAEGFGADTIGAQGSGVTTYLITTTNGTDVVSGSIRDYVNIGTGGPVAFAIGGLIDLEGDYLRLPQNCELLGSTCPTDSGGITFTNGDVLLSSENILIGVRIWRGYNGPTDDAKQGGYDKHDALSIEDAGVSGCIVAYSAAGMAIDENIELWNTSSYIHDITYQNNIFGYPLTTEGMGVGGGYLHPSGRHAYNQIVGDYAYNISNIHNLYAHGIGRNPLWKLETDGEQHECVQIGWEWGGKQVLGTNVSNGSNINFIGNYSLENLNTLGSTLGMRWNQPGPSSNMFVSGNINPKKPAYGGTESDCWNFDIPNVTIQGSLITSADSGVYTLRGSTTNVVAYVSDNVGVIFPGRDSLELQLISDMKNGTGDFIASQNEVGGIPSPAQGTVATDTDGDGLPDHVETRYGTNPAVKDSHELDLVSTGYSWIRKWALERLGLL